MLIEPSAVSALAFAGKAGSGKTALARSAMSAMEDLGRAGQQVSFATPLRGEVLALYGLGKGDDGWREAMRAVSAQRRSEHGQDYWLDALAGRVKTIRRDGLVPVIDDLRLPAELAWCQANGFYAVRVDAGAQVRAARLSAQGFEPDAAYSVDSLECALDDARFDRRLRNDARLSHGQMRALGARVLRFSARLTAPAGQRRSRATIPGWPRHAVLV